MSALMDVTYYLSKVIGPRPTGTEEEQQAALYITEQFQRETGFSANIEEFQRTTRPDLSFAILGSIVAIVALLSIFFPAISIPAFIIIVLVGGVYVLETFGHPLLSHVLAKGASQNVIAKYQPNLESGGSRSVTRKLILVAHYDSGHVTPSLVKRLDSGKTSFNVIESAVMALLAFLGLIRIFVAITGGGALIILNVITVLAALIALLPLVRFILINNAPYNEGANNNASGSAMLIEIARRISQGSVNENDLINMAEDVVIHGEDAALDAGLIPEGVELSYEAAVTGPLGAVAEVKEVEEDAGSEEDRLLAAKAAIAALTGRPVENRLYVTPLSDTPKENSDVAEVVEDAAPIATDTAIIGDDQAALTNEEGTNVQVVVDSQETEVLSDEDPVSQTIEVPSEQVEAQVVETVEPAPEPMSISAYFAAVNAEANGGQPMSNLSASAFVAQTQEATEPAVAAVAPAVIETAATVEETAEEESVAGFQNVPSWFAAAQKNAKRSDKQTEVQRSRFTEALEYAEHERIARETAQLAEEMERMEAERLEREAEARARIEAQQQQIEAAKVAKEEAAQADAELKQAQSAAGQIENEIAAESPIPGMDESTASVDAQTQPQDQTPTSAHQSADNDLVQQALDYKAAQETENSAAVTRSMMLPTIASPEAVTSAVEAAGNRQERLMNLRTSVPSLSGVIRTKDAARRAAVESLSSKLGSTEFTAQSSLSQQTTVMPLSPAETNVLSPAAPLREAPATRNLQAVSGGRSLSSIPSPADNVSASQTSQEVDYDMVLSGYDEFDSYQEDFAGGYGDTFEGDFASNLFDEESYADDFSADSGQSYNYGEYDNAFLDDNDFAAEQKPKRKGFFSRLLHRKEEEEDMDSPQQWLGVDDDFDARSVGRARGGWESFRQDYDDVDDPFNDDGYDDFGDFGDEYSSRSRGGRWEGGSYSRMSLGHVDMRSGVDTEADMTIPDTPPEAEKDRFITGEIERIYHFRNPAFNTEIWFVAMGCDDASHDGVRAFIAEHKAELRGSMIIEIESMGAGVLSVAKREGATKKISASSRIKRHTREAVAATGIALDEVDMSGTESIASIIQKAGFQSMHLFGAENGRPALKGSADDIFENIDELVFDENTRFVYELLKR